MCCGHVFLRAMRKAQKSVTLTQRQLAFLVREAARLGISTSDVVRRFIDAMMDAESVAKKDKP